MNPTFSPADSLLSAPSECYSSLFDTESSPPCESVFTPRSMLDDDSEASSPLRITIETADEKKPAKKRKSWGQELPIPKTNLPPRKRAKTDDEKEQRRIERVLRNRAAAQSSRERKRLEVEGLAEAKADVERKFANLEARLREAEMQKMALREQVAQMAAQLTVLKQGGSVASSPTHSTASPTLSTDLYHSRQGDSALQIKLEHDISFDFSIPPPPQATVDPRDSRLSSPAASSSPCLDLPNATTPNSTQYPAAVLCDLQCQLGATRPHWEVSRAATSPAPTGKPPRANPLALLLSMFTLTPLLFLHLSSTVSSLLHTPLTAIFTSLKTGSSLSPAELSSTLLLTLVQWLISTPVNPLTTPPNPSPSTSTTSTKHPTSTSSRRPTIRITLLHRLLACSPALALPLRDATGRALQLISRRSLARSSTSRSSGGHVLAGPSTRPADVPGAAEATMESLMTTLWAIESFERAKKSKQEISGASVSQGVGQGEAAGDMRRLCETIDDLFSSGGSGGRVTIPLGQESLEGKALDGVFRPPHHDNGSESGHCDDPT